jgi:hypothetical protein
MIPDPPPLDLIREAQQIIERIGADPKNAVWSEDEVKRIRDAWRWISDPEDPVPWRVAREFFSARYRLKWMIRANHCKRRAKDVAAALDLTLKYPKINRPEQVLEALRFANKLRLSARARCRPPWTKPEMCAIAAAREFIVEHREQVTTEMEDQFTKMIWSITRVGEIYLDHSVWQIACEMMDIDLSEDAIAERGGWTRN